VTVCAVLWTVCLRSTTMALRLFDVHPTGLNFFDRYFRNAMLGMQAMDFHNAMAEMAAMESEMARMRNQMYQLFPQNAEGGALDSDVQPRVPIIQEGGETKMKLDVNVKDFHPEEVKVKMLGNNILQVPKMFSITFEYLCASNAVPVSSILLLLFQ